MIDANKLTLSEEHKIGGRGPLLVVTTLMTNK